MQHIIVPYLSFTRIPAIEMAASVVTPLLDQKIEAQGNEVICLHKLKC